MKGSDQFKRMIVVDQRITNAQQQLLDFRRLIYFVNKRIIAIDYDLTGYSWPLSSNFRFGYIAPNKYQQGSVIIHILISHRNKPNIYFCYYH